MPVPLAPPKASFVNSTKSLPPLVTPRPKTLVPEAGGGILQQVPNTLVTDDPEFAGKVNCPVDSPPVAKLAHTATFVTSLSELFVTSRLRKKGDGGGPTFVACEIDVEIRNAASAVAIAFT